MVVCNSKTCLLSLVLCAFSGLFVALCMLCLCSCVCSEVKSWFSLSYNCLFIYTAAFADVVECRQRKEAVILNEYTVCSCIMALSPHTLKVILITTDYHTYRTSLVQIYIKKSLYLLHIFSLCLSLYKDVNLCRCFWS